MPSQMDTTETRNPRSVGLDAMADEGILGAFLESQERAVAAVRDARDALAQATRAIVARIGEDGRLIYVGAGSSGLIAALDGMELAGTFGWPEARTAFLLAGGYTIAPGMAGSVEDDAERGRAEMVLLKPKRSDAVIAVAASGSTPFTIAATVAASEAGALTVGLASNASSLLLKAVDVPVFLDTGAEIIVGSTRMGAGTAQKAALGLLSSLAMIRLGHVYDGFMVDLRADNAKLRRRAVQTLVAIAGCAEPAAADALDRAGGKVKKAALVLRGLAPAEAELALAAAGGNLRTAFARLN
jgi:N-acetylmuramic acid 6-phosphate etherase